MIEILEPHEKSFPQQALNVSHLRSSFPSVQINFLELFHSYLHCFVSPLTFTHSRFTRHAYGSTRSKIQQRDSDREREQKGRSGGGRGGRENGSSSDAVARVGGGHSGRRGERGTSGWARLARIAREVAGSGAERLSAAAAAAARDRLAQTRPPLADPRGQKLGPRPLRKRAKTIHAGSGSVYAIRYGARNAA